LTSVLNVGLDSAKDGAYALQGVKRLAEALVPWLARNRVRDGGE
jgi:hypothetical protein